MTIPSRSRVADRIVGIDRVRSPRGRSHPVSVRLGPALRTRRRLHAGLVQLAYVVLAAALGVFVPRISVGTTVPSARATEVLVAVGAALVPFIGLVYSLLFLVVQFGSTTFTPRLNIFRDAPIVRNAFSFFTGIVVFAFTAVLAIADEAETTLLLPIVAIVAVLAALGVFRSLQASAFRSIQLASTLAQVAERGRVVIDGVYPDELGATAHDHTQSAATPKTASEKPGPRHEVVWPDRPMTLRTIDVPRLLDSAERANAQVELLVGPGDLVAERAPVAVIRGGAKEIDRDLLNTFGVGIERTFEQDPAFALRVLADIALRALSPAVNDPTTAVQALDTIDGLLRALVTRDLDIKRLTGADGEIRVVLKLPGWEDYVGVALNEIAGACSSADSVRDRLHRRLSDLLSIAPSQRQTPLQALLVRLGAHS
jgi:uncharacterized membrane protein